MKNFNSSLVKASDMVPEVCAGPMSAEMFFYVMNFIHNYQEKLPSIVQS